MSVRMLCVQLKRSAGSFAEKMWIEAIVYRQFYGCSDKHSAAERHFIRRAKHWTYIETLQKTEMLNVSQALRTIKAD